MVAEPLVSVVMPMFNSERYLEEAIESILHQTYRNFELIIIDDGSTDGSWGIVSRISQLDKRIRPVQMITNSGVAAACNTGIQVAQGKYIARMDADDISLPERFSTLIAFMESHPNIGVLGSGMGYMDETGKRLGILPLYQSDLVIRWHVLFESPIYHASVMIRKSILDAHEIKYDTQAIYGEEDYELWTRLLLVTQGENIPEVLYYYRLYSGSVSQKNVSRLKESLTEISSKAVKTHLPNVSVSLQEIKDLQNAISGNSSASKKQRAKLIPVYFNIWDEFHSLHSHDENILRLERRVIAWAARMILYPLNQPQLLKAIWLLTKRNWLWPLILLENIPYYISRKRIGFYKP